jgi:hypothetical protein
MIRNITSVLVSLSFAVLMSSSALAQESPAAWVASPDVYKVIGENAQFWIVLASWKPGQIDNPHSHKAGTIVYLTDCNIRNHRPGAEPADNLFKVGEMRTIAGIPSHRAENIGNAECQMIHIERK